MLFRSSPEGSREPCRHIRTLVRGSSPVPGATRRIQSSGRTAVSRSPRTRWSRRRVDVSLQVSYPASRSCTQHPRRQGPHATFSPSSSPVKLPSGDDPFAVQPETNDTSGCSPGHHLAPACATQRTYGRRVIVHTPAKVCGLWLCGRSSGSCRDVGPGREPAEALYVNVMRTRPWGRVSETSRHKRDYFRVNVFRTPPHD